MRQAGIYKTIVQVTIFFLLGNLCQAEYDIYCLGASYTVDSGYIQSFADSAGIKLRAGSSLKGNMRTQAQSNRLEAPLSELSTGTADALIMTAQRPFKFTEAESQACIKLSGILLEKNPDARIFIHDYWTVVQPYWSLYSQEHGRDNVRALHLGGIKTISLMAHRLKHKVYDVPVGEAIQLLREKIEKGELEEYKKTYELMSDSIHLSEVGRYVQACMSFCCAYKYDVRKLSGEAVSSRGHKIKFTKNDAEIIHEIIYETVRNTPYSGWYENEPESTENYLKHLEDGLKNWESFDKLYPASGTGTFKGDNGIEWNYTDIRSNKDEEILTDAYVIMNRDSSLSATIPGGVSDLHFALYNGAEIEVLIGSKSMGTFKATRQNGWADCYFNIQNVNESGDVKVSFISKNNDSRIDNIFWTAPE
jgi:hypothetical protein